MAGIWTAADWHLGTSAAWDSLELKALAPLELLLDASFLHSEMFFLNMGNFLWHLSVALHCFPFWPKAEGGSQRWFPHLDMCPLLPIISPTVNLDFGSNSWMCVFLLSLRIIQRCYGQIG